MKYLLDTCVISDFVKGEPGTKRQLKAHSPAQLAVSSITLMEIEYALQLNQSKAVKLRLLLEQILGLLTVIPFGKSESICAVEIRTVLNTKGITIGYYDVLIAASALINDYILVTANLGEFQKIPDLKLENWRI